MFGFRITYLRSSVTAADVRSGNEKDAVEWPPHPDRLFCALVQAWGDLGETEVAREALVWLEQLHEQSPPLIRCGQTLTATIVQRFVPVNDVWNPVITDSTGKKSCAPFIAGTLLGRDRKPRRIPVATLSDDTVVFWWPDANPTPKHHASLAELSSAVASLGHPSCLVSVEALDDVGVLEPTWVPRPDGSETLRIPTRGRLNHLHEAYRARPRRRPAVGEWATYGPLTQGSGIQRGHHRDLSVYRLVSDNPPLPLESTSKVIAVWRNALLSKADQPVAEAVSGHAPESSPAVPVPSQRSHLALLPLGDVGHRYARSHLLGLAAALPTGLLPQERRACFRSLGRVDSLALGGLGTWRLERCDTGERRRGLLAETWCRSSLVWATVTPVVFGRYPSDLWGDEAAAMVREACTIAGLPTPAQVSIAPVAWVLGVPPAQRFPALASRPGKPRRAHAHVKLVFSNPVAGPLLVGAGRHKGYGLFRQLEEDAE
jgi:CRISPR-associated protein Csb2